MIRNTLLLILISLLAPDCTPTGESNENTDSSTSFHTAPAKAPEAGSLFLYPERIPLEAGGFFAAERGMLFVPLNRSKVNTDVIFKFRIKQNQEQILLLEMLP